MRISVVIPCYNAEAYLSDALASVECQSRKVYETIVVDDSSTDGSPAVARRFGVRCISTSTRSGPAAARNLGIAAAEGDVIAFLDADDVWTPDHCEVVAGLLEAHPQADVAFSRFRTFGTAELVSPATFPTGAPYEPLPDLLISNYVGQAAAIVRRAALVEIGGYREHAAVSYAEDYDLWLRLAQRHLFVGVLDVTVRYRMHEAQRWNRRADVVCGIWHARHDTWRAFEATPNHAPIAERLRDVWTQELRRAWISADVSLFDALLEQRPLVPLADGTADRWVWRRRHLWSTWRAVAGAIRALPFGTAQRLKRLLPTT